MKLQESVAKSRDAAGHEHSQSDGRFVSAASIEAKHSNAKTGTVDTDATVGERAGLGHFTQTDGRKGLASVSGGKPHAILMYGGGGCGKTGISQKMYVGNEGRPDIKGNAIRPGDAGYISAQPGFAMSRYFGADDEKENVPLFTRNSDENGMYGASGPINDADLARYTPAEREKVNAFIREQTGFKDANDFALHALKGPRDKDHPEKGNYNDGSHAGVEFGGGLTHELSSYVSKSKLEHALGNPGDGSFVYDAIGSPEYADIADRAHKAGYHVVLHHVHSAPEVAHFRAKKRGRGYNPARLTHGHHKAAAAHKALKAYSERAAAAGKSVEMRDSRTDTDEDVKEARDAGFTPGGPTAKKGRKAADMAKIDVPVPRKMSALVSHADALRKSYTDGSYEDHMKLVRPHVIAGSGCEKPEPVDRQQDMMSAPSISEGSHYQDVVATFPEYAIVLCNSEDKAWKVPYERDGDTITTGDPVEVEQQFVPTDESDEEEDESDEEEDEDE